MLSLPYEPEVTGPRQSPPPRVIIEREWTIGDHSTRLRVEGATLSEALDAYAAAHPPVVMKTDGSMATVV